MRTDGGWVVGDWMGQGRMDRWADKERTDPWIDVWGWTHRQVISGGAWTAARGWMHRTMIGQMGDQQGCGLRTARALETDHVLQWIALP